MVGVNLPAGVTVEPHNGVSPLSFLLFNLSWPPSLPLTRYLSITLFLHPFHTSHIRLSSLSLCVSVSPSVVQGRRRSDSQINSRPCDVLISQRWGQRRCFILSGLNCGSSLKQPSNEALMKCEWVNHSMVPLCFRTGQKQQIQHGSKDKNYDKHLDDVFCGLFLWLFWLKVSPCGPPHDFFLFHFHLYTVL